jgi:hypothetical protein
MANFTAVTASNGPRLKHFEAVERTIGSYYVDSDFNVGVAFDATTGEPHLFVYGYVWPEAWKLPEGVQAEDFDPYVPEVYEEGAEGFEQLLIEIAPHLAEPLTVQAVGNTKCRFPLSACEWTIEPGATSVTIHQFTNGQTEPTAA